MACLWENDGKLVENAGGTALLECDDCPCNPCGCDSFPDTLNLHLDDCGGFGGDYTITKSGDTTGGCPMWEAETVCDGTTYYIFFRCNVPETQSWQIGIARFGQTYCLYTAVGGVPLVSTTPVFWTAPYVSSGCCNCTDVSGTLYATVSE